MKYFFTIILFLAITQNSISQSVEFGVKGGASFTSVLFEPAIEQKSMINYHGGIGLRFLNAKNAGVQLELNYALRSYREDIDSVNYQGRNYKYLEIPFLMHLQFGKSKVKYYVHFGPHLGYALSAEREEMQDGEVTIEAYELLPNRDNRWDYGLAFGFGIGYDIGPGKLQAEGRYMYSFGNIEKSLLVTRTSQPINIQLSVGYFFPIHTISLGKLSPKNLFSKPKVEEIIEEED
ncbi:porin family protein [Peijinzhouia sedimentorum]